MQDDDQEPSAYKPLNAPEKKSAIKPALIVLAILVVVALLYLAGTAFLV